MYIKNIHINTFGRLKNLDLDLTDGLNVIEGKNESGKSTLLSFIKFVLYGADTHPADNCSLSEKKLFMPWDGQSASGNMTVVSEGKTYRVERELSVSQRTASDGANVRSAYREKVALLDGETGAQVRITHTPGETILGVPEEVFRSTAFVGQLSGAYVNGENVSTAIENLLFSADESVNTDKALEKLDEARRRLWHKSRKGGEIYDLECHRDEVLGRMEESKRSASEIMSLENTVATCRENLTKNSKRTEEVVKLTAVAEAFSVAKRFDILHAHEAKLVELDRRLKEYESAAGGVPDEAALATLRARADDAASTRAAVAKAKAALESADRGDIKTEADEYLGKVHEMGGREEAEYSFERHRKGIGTCIVTGILFILLALIFGAAAALTYFGYLRIPEKFWVPIAVAAVLPLVMGIISFVRSGKHREYVKNALDAVGAASPDDYSMGLGNLFEIEAIREQQRKEIEHSRQALELSKARENDASAALVAALGSIGKAGDDLSEERIADVIREAENHIAEKRAITAEIDRQSSALRFARDQLEGVNEAEIRATLSEADPAEAATLNITALKREREFLITSASALTSKLGEAERRLAALSALRSSPAELSAEASRLDAKIKELTLRHDAYSMAEEAIASAGESLRHGISPKVSSAACRLLASMTGGKYCRLGVGEDFVLSCEAGGMTREIDYLSSGTRDLTYVALRLALMEVVYRRGIPPLFFDETFARVDDERLERVLHTLSEFSEEKDGHQILLFTCQDRENRIMDVFGGVGSEDYRRICL